MDAPPISVSALGGILTDIIERALLGVSKHGPEPYFVFRLVVLLPLTVDVWRYPITQSVATRINGPSTTAGTPLAIRSSASPTGTSGIVPSPPAVTRPSATPSATRTSPLQPSRPTDDMP